MVRASSSALYNGQGQAGSRSARSPVEVGNSGVDGLEETLLIRQSENEILLVKEKQE
jgi:hypothetical protein